MALLSEGLGIVGSGFRVFKCFFDRSLWGESLGCKVLGFRI